MLDEIPRDAAGDPVFLILPDRIRASYDRKLAACEAGWRETADPVAVSEAAVLVRLHRQPLPRWLTEAVVMLADDRRGRAHAKRALEAAADSVRYQVVRDLKQDGETWEEAYALAAHALGGSEHTMEAAYKAAVYCDRARAPREQHRFRNVDRLRHGARRRAGRSRRWHYVHADRQRSFCRGRPRPLSRRQYPDHLPAGRRRF